MALYKQHGLPQKRKRVIIVGNLEQTLFRFPEPLHFEHPTLPTFAYKRQLTLLDAIGDLPEPAKADEVTYETMAQCDYQQELRRIDDSPVRHHQVRFLNDAALQRIRMLKQGETMKRLPIDLQHPSFARRAYRRVMDGTPTEKRGGAPSGIKRLISYEPSLTITSGSPSEFIHPIQDRPLTLRECARIQSFPDWYEFYGSWSSITTQIGNAIPHQFMKLLAMHIRHTATWHRIDSSRGHWLGIDASESTGMSPVLVKMLNELRERTMMYA